MFPTVEIYFDSDTESDIHSGDIPICRRNVRETNVVDLPEER